MDGKEQTVSRSSACLGCIPVPAHSISAKLSAYLVGESVVFETDTIIDPLGKGGNQIWVTQALYGGTEICQRPSVLTNETPISHQRWQRDGLQARILRHDQDIAHLDCSWQKGEVRGGCLPTTPTLKTRRQEGQMF